MCIKKITPRGLAIIAIVFMASAAILIYFFCIGKIDFIDPDITMGVIFTSGLVGFISSMYSIVLMISKKTLLGEHVKQQSQANDNPNEKESNHEILVDDKR